MGKSYTILCTFACAQICTIVFMLGKINISSIIYLIKINLEIKSLNEIFDATIMILTFLNINLIIIINVQNFIIKLKILIKSDNTNKFSYYKHSL